MNQTVRSWFEWPAAPASAAVISTGVQVLAFTLDLADDVLAAFETTLSLDERARADRFVFDVHRRRYVAGRGVLRDVLSHVVGCPAGEVRFEYGTAGKPRLASGWPEVHFSATHSADIGLIAVSAGRHVGVDAEHHQRRIDWRAVARAMFAPAELLHLETLTADQQAPAFFACWSRQEAYLKARGTGLGRAAAPSLLVTDAQPDGWWIADLPVGPPIAASVAAETPLANVTLNRWVP